METDCSFTVRKPSTDDSTSVSSKETQATLPSATERAESGGDMVETEEDVPIVAVIVAN